MIVDILYYNDAHRAIAFSLISIFLVYCVRNKKTMTRILSCGIYLVLVSAWFTWLLYMVSYVNKAFSLVIFVWGMKWICFFLAITIIQLFVYRIWGSRKDIGLLIINAAVVAILYFFAITYIK